MTAYPGFLSVTLYTAATSPMVARGLRTVGTGRLHRYLAAPSQPVADTNKPAKVGARPPT
jgi:hypothetical protein